jgi:hypothetical protein
MRHCAKPIGCRDTLATTLQREGRRSASTAFADRIDLTPTRRRDNGEHAPAQPQILPCHLSIVPLTPSSSALAQPGFFAPRRQGSAA